MSTLSQVMAARRCLLMPGANWSHNCRYVTVTAATHQDTPALWPPEMGRLPAPWRLLHRPDDVPEWQLMPTTS